MIISTPYEVTFRRVFFWMHVMKDVTRVGIDLSKHSSHLNSQNLRQKTGRQKMMLFSL